MSGDPQPGLYKSLRVLFRKSDRNDPINTSQAQTFAAGEQNDLVLDLNAINPQTVRSEATLRAQSQQSVRDLGNVPGAAVACTTYGPATVTPILQASYNAAGNKVGFTFLVSNNTFGEDPQNAVVKSCSVLIRDYLVSDIVLTSTYRTLTTTEGGSIQIS